MIATAKLNIVLKVQQIVQLMSRISAVLELHLKGVSTMSSTYESSECLICSD